MKLENDQITQMTEKILGTPKYRGKGIPAETISDLIIKEAPNHSSAKLLLKSVKRKLHNIVAPYLGEPNYEKLAEQLNNIKETEPSSPQIHALSLEILSQHASTAERIPNLESFYEQIFQITGKPGSVLDLASGLHPVGFPFMHLPASTLYHAYDIIQPRIDFLNLFFKALGLQPLAENRDILVSPPEIHADMAFFLKEAHRFEKRSPGCNQAFWAALHVDALVVSLPSHNLGGTHPLIDQHRRLVQENLSSFQEIIELQVGNEMVFIIKT